MEKQHFGNLHCKGGAVGKEWISNKLKKEMLEFQAFLGRRLAEGTGNLPVEEIVKEFRTHQLEAERLNEGSR